MKLKAVQNRKKWRMKKLKTEEIVDGGAKSEVDVVDEETEGGGEGVRILKAVLEVVEVEVLTSVFNFRY
jgi:hypothetical protein